MSLNRSIAAKKILRIKIEKESLVIVMIIAVGLSVGGRVLLPGGALLLALEVQS